MAWRREYGRNGRLGGGIWFGASDSLDAQQGGGVKVSELEGAQLDYWVGRAGGISPRIVDGRCVIDLPRDPLIGPDFVSYEPSRHWIGDGPIIEREGMMLMYCPPIVKYQEPGFWSADMDSKVKRLTNPEAGEQMANLASGVGPTPLVAAMRTFVASKFGDEVPE